MPVPTTTLANKPLTPFSGLGLLRLTHPAFALPDTQTFPLLHAAIGAGATVWSGADFYGTPEANSLHLLRRYFETYPADAERVTLVLKTGLVDRMSLKMDCSAANLRSSVTKALEVLGGVKGIDVLAIARVDPEVEVEESVAALEVLRTEGLIGGVGLSEVKAETIKRAAKVARIDVVEAEASLWSPEVFGNGVVEVCGELGIVVLAHTPLGMGALTGSIVGSKDLEGGMQALKVLPRYQEGVLEGNLKLVRAIEVMAREKGCSTAQLALGWLRGVAKGEACVVPVAGARSEDRVRENAAKVELSQSDFDRIETILQESPVEGYRTMPAMAKLNEY